MNITNVLTGGVTQQSEVSATGFTPLGLLNFDMIFLQMLHPAGVIEFYDVCYLQISLQLEQSKL